MQKDGKIYYFLYVERGETPREELSRIRRHGQQTQYLKKNSMTIVSFLRWYKEQTGGNDSAPIPDESSGISEDENIFPDVNSADYALHHYEPMSKWKK